jgi:hypothetical protein
MVEFRRRLITDPGSVAALPISANREEAMSLNDVDFTGRMQAGRDLAALRRHRDTAPSRPKFAKRPPAEDTPENRLYAELAYWRAECAEKDNTIAVLQNGGSVDEPIDHGLEFDRLVAATKAERQGLPPLPSLSPHISTTPARTRGDRTMTTNQYLAALKKLGLTPAARATADALGLSVRQCQRLASGEQAIPETVAKLLRMYLDHGLPE